MESVVEFEQNMARTGIFSIIVGEFSPQLLLTLIVLLLFDKDLRISLYCIILPFNLAVNLGIEDNRKFLLGVQKIT